MVKIVHYVDKKNKSYLYKITIPENIFVAFHLDTSKQYDWSIGKNGSLTLVERAE